LETVSSAKGITNDLPFQRIYQFVFLSFRQTYQIISISNASRKSKKQQSLIRHHHGRHSRLLSDHLNVALKKSTSALRLRSIRTRSSAASFWAAVCRRRLKACLMRRMLETELAIDDASLEARGTLDWWPGIVVLFGCWAGGWVLIG
jgi:hypothetical protein